MKRNLLVVGALVGAIAVIAGVAAQWQRIAPQLKLPEQNELVIHTPSVTEVQKQQITKEAAELQTLLDTFAKRYPGQFAIVATDMVNGATASVAADDQMVAASLYKLFVGYGIYKKIDAGELKTSSHTKGSALTVGQCLYIMITISDNDCGYYLGAMVGWAQLDADLARLGLTKTSVNNYVAPGSGNIDSDKLTSAADVAKFTEALYKGKLLSAGSTEAYLNVLKATRLNTWLPSGMPAGTVFAHKTGALYNLVHDAGVVYTQKGDYVVVVMSRNWQDAAKQSPPVFADISRQLWHFFNI